jgi:hypothetical protein
MYLYRFHPVPILFRNYWKSVPKIIAEIPEITVCLRAIQRRLDEAKLFSKRSGNKPFISIRNSVTKVPFARLRVRTKYY